jgi:hypothetical protein
MTCEKGAIRTDGGGAPQLKDLTPQDFGESIVTSVSNYGRGISMAPQYSMRLSNGLLDMIEVEARWGTPGPMEFGRWEEKRGGKGI